MDNKKIVIFGGGTISHVRNHLGICAPAYGRTARKLAALATEILPTMDVVLKLTQMASMGLGDIETNEDVEREIDKILKDDVTKVIIMNVALCDYNGTITDPGTSLKRFVEKSGKYEDRLQTSEGVQHMRLTPAEKIISKIRKERKDIFLVGFKTTCGATEDEQYLSALNLCKKSSCNLVFANDTKTRLNLIATPEEARYHVTTDRDEALTGLLKMVFHRTHLTFTRSTVVAGDPIPWNSKDIPDSLRTVVNYCIQNNAYKPFNGVTAGHFACKINDTTFLTSIRKTNFNKLPEVGLVKIVTDGPDTVLAYGAKPSVGGQSQRIVFNDHKDCDCIVHFHTPILPGSKVPVRSQYEFSCGSHECGTNTSKGLSKFGNLYAVYLDNHGPNIVFNHKIDPQEVINFIEENFDLTQKTGGFTSALGEHIGTTFEDAQKIL